MTSTTDLSEIPYLLFQKFKKPKEEQITFPTKTGDIYEYCKSGANWKYNEPPITLVFMRAWNNRLIRQTEFRVYFMEFHMPWLNPDYDAFHQSPELVVRYIYNGLELPIANKPVRHNRYVNGFQNLRIDYCVIGPIPRFIVEIADSLPFSLSAVPA